MPQPPAAPPRPRTAAPCLVLERGPDGAPLDPGYLEALGTRAALLGDRRGGWELWIWPLKVLDALRLEFVHAGQREGAAQTLRRVERTPGGLRLEHAGRGWRVEWRVSAAPEGRALATSFHVECEDTLELRVGLEPAFRPMWPAGLGGQIARRDPDTGALCLTEELGRFAALVGSPEAEPLAFHADHALPRGELVLRLRVTPARAARGPLPLAFAGAQDEPPPLSPAARVGQEGAARGEARGARVVAAARELWRRALTSEPEWRAAHAERWGERLAGAAQLSSDDARLDAAFLWSQVAIGEAEVEVEGVGRGLVAGLGPSRGGERPGFAWFFDGDALVAARALLALGDGARAAEVLRFAAAHQREDGKLMHELVLSSRLCRWVEDYPYAYYKSTNTPAFLAVLAQHLACTGDLELVRELWPTARRAFEFACASVDPDGLFSVARAGLCAVEAGPLVGRLRSEVFAHGIWTGAARGMRDLARALGDGALAQRAALEAERAEQAFERFWCEERGRYGFGRLLDDSTCADLTAYLGLPLARGLGRPERALASAGELNSTALTSDWGARMFARDAEGYDPGDYNTGSVFPYLNGHVVLALYRHGLAPAAWQVLAGQVALDGFGGPGLVPEHLEGELCREPVRGVPHQVFSSAAIVQSVVHGLFGLAWRAEEGVLVVRGALPAHLGRARLSGLRFGGRVLDLALARREERGRSVLALEVELREGSPLIVLFRPCLPLGTRAAVQRFAGDAREHALTLAPRGAALEPRAAGLEVAASAATEVVARTGPEPLVGVDVVLPRDRPSRDVRWLAARERAGRVEWTLEGRSGSRARLAVRGDPGLALEGAARAADGALEWTFAAEASEFARHRLAFEVDA